MTEPAARAEVAPNQFGRMLKHWRAVQRMSQLELALAANISARHLSFIETGRSQPSREIVMLIGEVLDLPLRDRNALLRGAGYADRYRETKLSAPEMAHVASLLEFVLTRHEPFPAIVLDRRWNLVMSNEAATRLVALLCDPAAVWQGGPPNIMKLLFHPEGFRPWLVNWEDLARSYVNRLHRERAYAGSDDAIAGLLGEIFGYSGIPAGWEAPDIGLEPWASLAPAHIRKGDFEARLFSGVMTVGRPQDITLDELSVELFFPADAPSESAMQALAGL